MIGAIRTASVTLLLGFTPAGAEESNGLERALMFIGSTCLLLPVGNFVVFITPLEGDLRYLSYAAGIAALAAVFVLQRMRGGEDPAPA